MVGYVFCPLLHCGGGDVGRNGGTCPRQIDVGKNVRSVLGGPTSLSLLLVPVVMIETGAVGEKGVVVGGVERMEQRKTAREDSPLQRLSFSAFTASSAFASGASWKACTCALRIVLLWYSVLRIIGVVYRF